ncbi:MAG: UDP-N-acetylmuramate dehydrogenase [Clostridia bacterium]|nr:UDP-N-acetylmuramate dehydrogenase [Clostridia bacterium]
MTNINLFVKEVHTLDVERDVDMKRFTTFKIGGKADLGVYPKTKEELELAVRCAKALNIPYYVVGRGSNLLVDDKGYRGIIIFTSSLNKVTYSDSEVYAQAGVSLTSLAREAGKRGLTGMEKLCGIPGSVGGAVYMNAGAYGSEMKDITLYSDFYSPSLGLGRLEGEEQGFDYRRSAYTDSDKIILGCRIKLSRGAEEEIRKTEEECLSARREKQPLEYPSAGSTFKRYPGRFTGKMIEEAGLKGFRVGGASVSEKHAGFLINDKDATCLDMISLISQVRKKVFEKEGVRIECEVKYLSEEGERII